jgi:hypothetical protein
VRPRRPFPRPTPFRRRGCTPRRRPIAPLAGIYRDELRSLGKKPDEHEIAAGITWLLVARDPEKARRSRGHFLYQINLYAQWFGEAGMESRRWRAAPISRPGAR